MFQNKACAYALLAMSELAQRHEHGEASGLQASEIATTRGMPLAYAAKIMTRLARSNLLRSDRGPRGGFRLTRDPEQISLLEIVEAVNGQTDLIEGFAALELPAAFGTQLQRTFEQAVAAARRRLESTTLAGFLAGCGDRVPAEVPVPSAEPSASEGLRPPQYA